MSSSYPLLKAATGEESGRERLRFLREKENVCDAPSIPKYKYAVRGRTYRQMMPNE